MTPINVRVVYSPPPGQSLNLHKCFQMQRDEAYQDMLARHVDTKRTQLDLRPSGAGGFYRVSRFDSRRNIKTPWQNGGAESTSGIPIFSHLEYTRYDGPQGGAWSIRSIYPKFLEGAITGEGTLRFHQEGNSVVRTISGEISAHVLPGLRSLVESIAVSHATQSLVTAAQITPEWLRVHPHRYDTTLSLPPPRSYAA